MKTTLLSLAALAALATAIVHHTPAGTASAQPPADPRAKDAEPLPEMPRLDPKSTAAPLNKEKTLFFEKTADDKVRRVLFPAEVCLREGPLEVLLCRKGTKEHEAILRADLDARQIHTALEAARAQAGKPTQFVNPKTNEPEFKPATGTPVKIMVHYKKDGKLHTHPVQEWVWNTEKKKPLDAQWVFAGSQFIPNPDRPTDPPYYGANSGEFISISNFPYSMLELPIEISKDDANLNFEAKTDRIPPLFSKVWVILEPVAEKK